MRPRLVKLGVKKGQRISLIGLDEQDFTQELEAIGASISRRLRRESGIIFFYVPNPAELERLAHPRRYNKPHRAVWVLRRKREGPPLQDVGAVQAGAAAR